MNDKRISSYPSIYAIGHRAIQDIFKDDVLVEEKIDGSQFSFMVSGDELHCRSKGQQLVVNTPEKMFERAINTVKELQPLLHDGWVYRAEYLQKPKHNTLCYARVPDKYLIIFDIMVGLEDYLSYTDKVTEVKRLGLEVVPMIYQGRVTGIDMFNELLERESILGGCNIEGLVVKNYHLFTSEKKIALGKYVSEKFKEKHGGEWHKTHPSLMDILLQLINTYRNENRWEKAVQHLRDDGLLEHSPRDIGLLIREVPNDVLKECENEIRDVLFMHFWPKIKRGITSGLPEWYKMKLANSAFETEVIHEDHE